jgi:hypothetical protein
MDLRDRPPGGVASTEGEHVAQAPGTKVALRFWKVNGIRPARQVDSRQKPPRRTAAAELARIGIGSRRHPPQIVTSRLSALSLRVWQWSVQSSIDLKVTTNIEFSPSLLSSRVLQFWPRRWDRWRGSLVTFHKAAAGRDRQPCDRDMSVTTTVPASEASTTPSTDGCR